DHALVRRERRSALLAGGSRSVPSPVARGDRFRVPDAGCGNLVRLHHRRLSRRSDVHDGARPDREYQHHDDADGDASGVNVWTLRAHHRHPADDHAKPDLVELLRSPRLRAVTYGVTNSIAAFSQNAPATGAPLHEPSDSPGTLSQR